MEEEEEEEEVEEEEADADADEWRREINARMDNSVVKK